MECPLCSFKGPFKERIASCEIPSWHAQKQLIRYECHKCQVIFGTLEVINMSDDELKDLYQKHYDPQKKIREDALETRALLGIDVVAKPGDRVLNWGSGPAARGVKTAKEKFGVDLFNYDRYGRSDYNIITDSNELAKLAPFDAIVSNDLIEHLQDPVSELRHMNSLLKMGAKMHHISGCWEYAIQQSEYHTFFFAGKSPHVLAEKTGFTAKALNRYNYMFTKVKHWGIV